MQRERSGIQTAILSGGVFLACIALLWSAPVAEAGGQMNIQGNDGADGGNGAGGGNADAGGGGGSGTGGQGGGAGSGSPPGAAGSGGSYIP